MRAIIITIKLLRPTFPLKNQSSDGISVPAILKRWNKYEKNIYIVIDVIKHKKIKKAKDFPLLNHIADENVLEHAYPRQLTTEKTLDKISLAAIFDFSISLKDLEGSVT